MNDGDLPGFDPTVLAIDGLGSADLGVLEIDPLLLVDKQLDVVSERALVALQGEDVIGFLVEDRLRDVTLAAHRVDGYDRTLDLQHAQELGDGDDLVGLLPHLDLAEYETLSRGESRHDVDRTLEILLLLRSLRTGPAHGFAVDGDDFGRNPGLRRDPGDKATLEGFGVQGRQNVAQVIMRGRSIRERSEASQKSQFQPAKSSDVGDRLRPGDDGEQAQQQDSHRADI